MDERGRDKGALGGGKDGQPEGVHAVGVQALRVGPELKSSKVVRFLGAVSEESEGNGVM